jgi:hypothetical protein
MVFNEPYSFPVNDYSGVFGTLCKMAQPASPASVLDATCKHLRPIIERMEWFQPGPFQCQFGLHPLYAENAISLVVTDKRDKKWLHPTFVTRSDLDNDYLTEDLLRWRIASALCGEPGRFPLNGGGPAFTLQEINEAQDFIEQCKQS